MTAAAPGPTWQSHLAHYAGDVLSAVRQSPAAIHAFISAFTSHPDLPGAATKPGSAAAVLIILAAIITLAGWARGKARSKS